MTKPKLEFIASDIDMTHARNHYHKWMQQTRKHCSFVTYLREHYHPPVQQPIEPTYGLLIYGNGKR